MHETETNISNADIQQALEFIVKMYELEREENDVHLHDQVVYFNKEGQFCINDPYLLFYARHK